MGVVVPEVGRVASGRLSLVAIKGALRQKQVLCTMRTVSAVVLTLEGIRNTWRLHKNTDSADLG